MNLKYATRGVETGERVRKLMKRTGRTPWGQKLWTKNEDDKIVQLYPDCGAIRKRIKSRSIAAIRWRAGVLGVRRKYYKWKANDVLKLRKLVHSGAHCQDLAAAFPEVSQQQIRRCIYNQSMKRPRKVYKPTGLELIDQIRKRAFEMNYTMVDLDHFARSKRYFQNGVWNHRLNAKAISRAVEELGGRLTVIWD